MNHQEPFFVEIRINQQDGSSREQYNNIYEDIGLSQIESFYLWLMEKLELPTQGRLLDVSCGAGEVIRLAGQHGLQATGIDLSEVAARTAHRNSCSFGSSACAASGENLPFVDKNFDIVTNIGSLEHFLDPARGAREMARVLKTDGKAYILLPNTFSLLTNIWHAFRTGETSADLQPIQRYGGRADWTRLLEQNGFKVIKATKYERPWPRIKADWTYYLKRPKEMFRLLVSPFVPLNLSFCFLFTCVRELEHEQQKMTSVDTHTSR